MRRYSDWVIFGIPAGLAVLLVLMGKISTADTAEYIKHSRVVFEGLKVAPYDYAVYRPPFFGAAGPRPTNAVYRAYRLPYDWIPELERPNEHAVTPPALADYKLQ